MKRKMLISYTYDFIRILVTKVDDISDVILFGSVARGDFRDDSDVDIFVNVDVEYEKSTKKAVDEALNEFEVYAKRTWRLEGVDMPIKCIVGDINSGRWSELKREIISSGICLYGRYKELPEKLNHYFIFSFSFSDLRPNERVCVIRKLYGYSTKKNAKIYEHKGLLSVIKGDKLGPSILIVPFDGYKKLVEFFRKNRVTFNQKEIWSE